MTEKAIARAPVFVGHFSAENHAPGDYVARIEHFTLVVSAADLAAAKAKFRTLILGARAEFLSDVGSVHLDACSEIHNVPADGFLSYRECNTVYLDGVVDPDGFACETIGGFDPGDGVVLHDGGWEVTEQTIKDGEVVAETASSVSFVTFDEPEHPDQGK